MKADSKIACPECVERQRRLGQYELPGNEARPSMGHAMYFGKDGRVALCILPRQNQAGVPG